MRALDVMTTRVVTVKPDMPVRDAAQQLVEHGISAVPVVDDDTGSVVGMLSEGDLLRRTEIDTHARRRSWWLEHFATTTDAERYVKSHGAKVADVMTKDVVAVDEETPLGEIAEILETRHIKRVPVTREGKLVGIVSRANIVQALASAPDEPALDIQPTDREIRAALMGEMAGHPWAFAGQNVVVSDGVIHLWGVFRSAEAVQAVRVAAESIPGVKRVEDHTEPYPIMPGI